MTLSIQDYAAIGGLIIMLVSPIMGYVIKIRYNDLRHLDQKADEIMQAVQRVEDKLDEHMRDHATGVFK